MTELATEKAIQVIWNPSAGPATDGSEVRQHLESTLGADLLINETSSADDAARIVHESADTAKMIIAAGGDGTINTVINSLMKCQRRPPLGLLPLGTGNNLCRSLGIPLEPLEAVEVVRNGKPVAIDLAHVSYDGGESYFANVASGGNSDRALECLENADKERWGPWCYMRSALPLIGELQAFDVQIRIDGGEMQRHQLWNVLVANGEFAAGGFRVAPNADPTNGLLDLILILDGTPLDLAGLTAEFFIGNYLEDERVIHHRVKSLEIHAEPELRFLADGETLTGQPFRFTAAPGVLSVIQAGEGAEALP